MTSLALYRQGVSILTKHHIPQADLDCAFFLSHLLGIPKNQLFLSDHSLSASQQDDFFAFIARRCAFEPLAYIIGEQEFWSLPFYVNSAVLIPRPETEILVEEVLKHIAQPHYFTGTILDLGTGSGVLPITLATELPKAKFVALDLSGAALQVAKRNCQRHKLVNRINLVQSSWQTGLKKGPCFEIIVSNPPYVDPQTFPTLQPDVVDYEPKLALDGGKKGQEVINRFCPDIIDYLKPGGWFFMEIGYDQKEWIYSLLTLTGKLSHLTVKQDYAGLPRLVIARRQGEEK